MRMGLGLGISRQQRAAGGAPPAFSPALIFTGTDTGFWSDPITPAVLWQDTARTNPVTAPGQLARSWQLNTRTGVIYATPAPFADPLTYQVDSNGRGFLLGNGSTTGLFTSSITGGPNYQVFAAIHLLSLVGEQQVIDADYVSGGRRHAQFLRMNGSTPESIAFSGGTPIFDSSTAITANSNNVISAIGQSGTSLETRTNGVSNGATATTLTFNTFTDQIHIGKFSGGASGYLNGRIYGAVARFGPNLTTQQITDTEAWLAALMNP